MAVLNEILSYQPLLVLSASSLLLITAYLVASSLYSVYFHPLSKFPGPKASAFTRIPYLRAQLSGKLPHYIKELHDRYNSNVVRISPDDLSFIEPSAWNDMLMFHRGRETFQKDVIIYGNPPQGVHAVLTANDVDHARMRRILAHAFSEKALKMQEPLIQSHVDILMDQLKQDSIKSGGKVDMEAWFRWTTFDIMGELAFGESIDCLRSERHRQWSSMIFDLSKALVYMSASRRYPWSEKILRYFLPKQLMRRTANNAKLISELVDRRLKGGNEKQDFCSYILKYNDEKGMTVPEIKANASLFMAAGTDSSATILTGCIYFLSQHPDALRRLTDDIRNAFKTQEDIIFANTPKLSYLQAVLDETTRMYPPTLAGQPHRVPKGGANISGYWVPSGVAVQINQWAAYQSRQNFAEPDSFIPERWLSDPRFSSDRKAIYQPFSVGPHHCIGRTLAGAEMRLIMCKLLWLFDLQASEDTKPNWVDQLVFLRWQKTPLIVRLIPRDISEAG